MSNKLKTSKKSAEVISNIIDLLEIKNSYFIIARLAIAITISIGRKIKDVGEIEDTQGKEFNEYTIFKDDNYNYYVVIKTILSDLYERELEDKELLGNKGLIKRHIDLGCHILDDIYQSTRGNKKDFLKKLYSFKFDQKLIHSYERLEEEIIPPKENITDDEQMFINKSTSTVVNFFQNLGFQIVETETILSYAILRIKIKLPPITKSILEIKKRTEDLKLTLGINADPLISIFDGFVCVDIPREKRQFINLKDIINSIEYTTPVTFPVGCDITGEIISLNLEDSSTPHLLVGGATGQGKSEFLKSVIVTLSTKNDPSSVELYLIDPKKVEFSKFKRLQNVKQVITEVEDTINLLEEMVEEMERRYNLMSQHEVNNLSAYNNEVNNKKPHIVIIFDEFADFILNDKRIKLTLEEKVKKLSGKARAAGIHLILSTQRPDKDIITPIIKANLPAKIAFKTTTSVNSQVVIDLPDAKKLLGKGDLILIKDGNAKRMQAPYIPDEELESWIENDQIIS